MKKYRTYTAEFKADALRMWEGSNESSAEVAAELGINDGVLRKWKEQATKAAKENTEPFPGSGNPRDEENYKLRKQLADTKMELEILKKAVAIFSRPQSQ
jgi:transposase